MRLIDVERFAIISKYHIPEVIEDTWEEGYCECLKVLDMTPTVKAIPIEWMKNYVEENYYYDGVIGRMIEYWEKENGK